MMNGLGLCELQRMYIVLIKVITDVQYNSIMHENVEIFKRE